MAFYNPNGFVPAFKQAKSFAGKDGHVATLPDIVEARLVTTPGEAPWENYFTTMSAEYVGLSRAGNPIAIVAHGIGPMATLDGVLAVYSHEFNDKGRNHRGGHIPQEVFLKLESGHFGEVSVVDLVATWNRRPYQFSNHAITRKEISEEPLWQARLGAKWLEYCRRHESIADAWYEERGEKTLFLPCIIAMDDASNCSYSTRQMFDHWMGATPGTAIAHLLSIGHLAHAVHEYYESDYGKREQRYSLACDVSCHEWWNGVRLLGIKYGAAIRVHPGLPDYVELVKTQLEKLWRMNPKGARETTCGFWHLVKIGTQFFTDYPKQGERMDNYEPEFLVTKIQRVGEPRQFRTTIGGYHGFFKYGTDEVQHITPAEANAYTVGDVKIECKGGNPTHHVADVTFYGVEVDTTRRLIRMGDIYHDFDLMMSLVS
jgi:hypothetical protein